MTVEHIRLSQTAGGSINLFKFLKGNLAICIKDAEIIHTHLRISSQGNNWKCEQMFIYKNVHHKVTSGGKQMEQPDYKTTGK